MDRRTKFLKMQGNPLNQKQLAVARIFGARIHPFNTPSRSFARPTMRSQAADFKPTWALDYRQ